MERNNIIISIQHKQICLNEILIENMTSLTKLQTFVHYLGYTTLAFSKYQ